MSINYPKGMKQLNTPLSQKKSIQYGKRGMKFEDMINESNKYYLAYNKAVIHKKPTPVQIVKVDYPKRSAAKITEAYFRQASTTDYNGVFKGHYIDFEAKETKNKTSFPLSNFHEHQIQHMLNCEKNGGLCFVLLWFSSLNKCYYLDFKYLYDFWTNKNQRKSILIKDLLEIGFECPVGYLPTIDYLIPLQKRIDC